MTLSIGLRVRLAPQKNLWLDGTIVRIDLREGREPRCWVRWSDDGEVGGPFTADELAEAHIGSA